MFELIKPGLNVDWIGSRKKFYTLSILACLGAIGVMVGNTFVRGAPLNYGTDFKGGSEIQVEFSRAVEAGQVRDALTKSGFKTATVVRVTDEKRPHFFMLRIDEVSAFSPAEQETLKAALDRVFKGNVIRFEHKTGSDKVYIRLKRDYQPAGAHAPPPPAAPESQPASQATASQPASQPSATNQPVSQPSSQPAVPPAAPGPSTVETSVAQMIEEAFKASKVEPQQVQRFGKREDNNYEVTLAGLDRDIRNIFDSVLGAGAVKDVPQVEAVGAKMGKQLRDAGIKSVIYSLLLILLYVAIRFDFRYAPGGVIALFHDVLITTGIIALTWKDFSMTAVAALLTLAGYSINDTIVIYDRIRENTTRYRDRRFGQIINASINETMSRTILTSFTTLITSATMWVLGVGDVATFAFIFSFGIIIGTYSTIAIASPLTLWLNEKFAKKAGAR